VDIPKKYIQTRNRLRASLRKFNRMPEEGQRSGMPIPELHKTEEELWRNEKRIRAHVYSSLKEIARPGIDLENLSSNLREGESLINYIITANDVGAYRIDSDKVAYISLPVNPDELHDAIREFHFLMERSVYSAFGYDRTPEVTRDYLKKMYAWLIEPLHLEPHKKKLIMLLDGIFGQVPYWSLIDGNGGWLSDRYDLSIISDPSDLMHPRGKSTIEQASRSAIFAPENINLPLAGIEARTIKNLFANAGHYDGEKANCAALLSELEKSAGFLHIAAHASRSSENPLFSRVLMSDGPFFPFDLFGTSVAVSLVTLSGCQTAAPGIYYGNSFSLAKAFYQAGARWVLASLWPISDKVSMVFMQEFYKNLKKNEDIYRAYKTALELTRNINENPAFWGPFVLLGI
jgi:CHAT domain-containing protein